MALIEEKDGILTFESRGDVIDYGADNHVLLAVEQGKGAPYRACHFSNDAAIAKLHQPTMIDATTFHLLKQVRGNLKPENQEHLMDYEWGGMMEIAWKLIDKVGV